MDQCDQAVIRWAPWSSSPPPSFFSFPSPWARRTRGRDLGFFWFNSLSVFFPSSFFFHGPYTLKISFDSP